MSQIQKATMEENKGSKGKQEPTLARREAMAVSVSTEGKGCAFNGFTYLPLEKWH
jgi:hypothetical protein